MEFFFCWVFFLFQPLLSKKKRESTLNLGLKKGAGSCASRKESPCRARWRPGLTGVLGLPALLAGFAGFAGWVCRLCWLGFAGCGPAACSFQQQFSANAFISLFFFSIPRKLPGAICPLYSRWHVSSLRLFWSLNLCDGLKDQLGLVGFSGM
ncbi:hypothetical protein FCV25MIE_19150 [Fagus crenata]